ncbi:hypothetical protein U9M48_000826 [Paspalum notatum var. saurae]|uniref:DDE Tnp4 domain-containing protein n=1 Tax=Paspalum notatum var. saurae TaxID=547442 RepID=A0AAQ3PFL2_PASNO
MPYFKDCIGAIDGTHITITMSPNLQDPYGNRKGGLSQNVMVAVRVGKVQLQMLECYKMLYLHGFYVPDGKYYFIAPYKNARYHLQEQGRANQRPSNAKELFNLRHA